MKYENKISGLIHKISTLEYELSILTKILDTQRLFRKVTVINQLYDI